ncbi:MAG: stage II sporulation protein M [Candidatus Methanomethylicaceae archaeon]
MEKENTFYIIVSLALLVIGIFFGVLIPKTHMPFSETPLYQILSPYVELYKPYEFSTVIFLFVKNSITISLAFFLSPLLLIFPSLVLLLNGFMTGFVASSLPIDLTIGALVPHGIFELSALVLGSAGGLRFGIGVIKKVVKKLRGEEYGISEDFIKGLKLFILSLVLLFVAAIIETYVTPFILGFIP